ncbi:MAG: WbqC family protein [Bacteroidales bacterium]
MREILLSTAYLPPIEYFAYLIQYDICKIENKEHYIKQSYRNRCSIITANGLLNLCIPVNKVDGNHTFTKDIRISNVSNWQINHWRAIESAYNKSPFFLYYKDDLLKFYMKRYESLIDFNSDLLKFILKKTGISVVINFTDDFIPLNEHKDDFRYSFSAKAFDEKGKFPHYYQVFENKHGFIPNLSIIDLLFNEGPESKFYLENLATKI